MLSAAVEVQHLVAEQACLGRTEFIDVLAWRNKLRFSVPDDDLAGEEILVALQPHEHAADALWAPIDFSDFLDDFTEASRRLYVMARGPPSRRGMWYTRSFEMGLVLIGVNHEPLPDLLGLPELRRRLAAHQAARPVTLNMWRLRDSEMHALAVKKCRDALNEATVRSLLACELIDCNKDPCWHAQEACGPASCEITSCLSGAEAFCATQAT